MTEKYNVIPNSGQFKDMTIGVVFFTESVSRGDGWVYSPYYQQARSRKTWDTPEAAIKGRVKDCSLEEQRRDCPKCGEPMYLNQICNPCGIAA